MPDLQALLDQIDRLEEHITPGPWEAVGRPYNACVSPAGQIRNLARLGDPLDPEAWKNAEFIALARTALPQLAKALRDIMEIHKPFHADHYYNGMDGKSLHRFVLRCDGCEESGGIEDYPCPTVQAITDQMEGDGA